MSRNLADLQYEVALDARAEVAQEIAGWKEIAQREAARADRWRRRNRTLGRLLTAAVLGGMGVTAILAAALISMRGKVPTC